MEREGERGRDRRVESDEKIGQGRVQANELSKKSVLRPHTKEEDVQC